MKTRSKLLLIVLNVLLFGGLLWAVVHLVYAPAGMSLELTSNMEELSTGERVELRFVIQDKEGEVVKDFERVHEKLLHLIVVREDLVEFQHLHPALDEETGEFSVDLSFDRVGPYQLFADFTPNDFTQTVLSFPLEVQDLSVYEAQTLSASSLEPFVLEGMTITPHFPEVLKTGEEVAYSFDVTVDGESVSLENYLGAKGHSVVLSEGDLTYIHTHPKDDTLSFQTVFDKAGTYKSFTQFQVKGRIYTIETVFVVEKGSRVDAPAEDPMEEMDHSSH